MWWISLCATRRQSSSSQGPATDTHVSPQTDALDIALQGEFAQFESNDSHIILVGAIQDARFATTEAAAQHAHLLEDVQCVRDINGSFALLLINKRTATIQIISSRSGGMRLYYYCDNSRILICTSLSSMASCLGDVKPDPAGVRDIFDYRWFMHDHSLLAGVSMVQPATSHELVFGVGRVAPATRYWHMPVRSPLPAALDEHAERVFTLLCDSLQSMIRPGARVALLLSGGVDSSIMAGVLSHLNVDFVAFSHRSRQHANPELETAVEFARCLGVEHRVIDLDDALVGELFEDAARIVEQPPRFQSSVILCRLFATMEGSFDQVIYGEAADTLYGSNMVNRFFKRQRKRETLRTACLKQAWLLRILARLLPVTRLRELAWLSPARHIASEHRLARSAMTDAWLDRLVPSSADSFEVLAHGTLLSESGSGGAVDPLRMEVAELKSLNFMSSIANHMHEVGALANHYGLELVVPFLDNSLIEYSATLDDGSYYGESRVKPVLRRLGERFYPAEMMHLPKIGFPAPYKSWLEGALRPLWEEVLACHPNVHPLDDDPELKWTLAGLAVVSQPLGLKPHALDQLV